MTEIDREMLMADRYDKQMRRNEVLEIREKAREKREGRKPAGRESKKRMETANDKSNKMREIAALRKDKEKRKQEESERNQARRKSSRDDDDDDDDDDEEAGPSRSRREDEEAQRRQEQRKRAQEEVKEVSAVPSDLERVRLTRQKLEQWLTEPFFDTVVVGCFVRINVGEKAGIPVYRVAEVVGVKDGFRKYQLGHTMTGKRLELQARLLPPPPTPSHPLPPIPHPSQPPNGSVTHLDLDPAECVARSTREAHSVDALARGSRRMAPLRVHS